MQWALNDPAAGLWISVLKSLAFYIKPDVWKEMASRAILGEQWAGNSAKLPSVLPDPGDDVGVKSEVVTGTVCCLSTQQHSGEWTLALVLKNWEKDGDRSCWNNLETEAEPNSICLSTERGLLSIILSKRNFDIIRDTHNTNRWLQNKPTRIGMKCPSVWRFFLETDYWKLSREVMDSCISWCLFKLWGFVMYYPWWGRSFLAMWNCKWKELWSPGGWCGPWAVCLRVPASTSISILPFRLKCGWANPSNQQHVGTCDCFCLYSKAFSPSCAWKSQSSSLFLWLGLSMRMEAAHGGSSSEWTVALVSQRVRCSQCNLCNPPLLKGNLC